MPASQRLFELSKIVLLQFSVEWVIWGMFPTLEAKAQIRTIEETTIFKVSQIEIVGNSIFSDRELKAIANLSRAKKISLKELLVAREKINRYYVERGYISSGAFISQQKTSQEKITIRIVEGKLSQIEIEGVEGLSEKYLKSQLPSLEKPFNVNDLIKSLANLEQEPLIENITGEIVKDRESFNRNILLIEIEERNPLAFSLGFNNAYSPSIGSYGGNAKLFHNNLLGFRDRLTIETSQTLEGGLSRIAGSYSFPFNKYDGRIKFSYNNADSSLIEEEVEELQIKAESESLVLEVRQPIAVNEFVELDLGIALEHIESETFVLSDFSFPFTEGLDDGEINFTVLRIFQGYKIKGDNSLFSFSTGFNVGLDIFDAT